MKVFQINSTCGYGSTGRIAVDILKEVEKNGGEGIIAYGRNSAPENVNSYRIGSDLQVKIHGVLSRITDRQGFYGTSATKKLIEKIKEYNPDIIHLHNIHGYYLNVAVLLKFLKEYNKPIVWTLHDCWAFTGHCAHFSYEKCDKWRTECYSCPLKKEYPTSLVMENSRKNFADKKKYITALKDLNIVTPSHWLAGVTRESFMGKYPVTVIYNGVDLNEFKPTESDFRKKNHLEDKQIILGVANVWTEKKGLTDFYSLNEKLRDNQVIVLVGLSDSQIATLPKGIIGIKRTESIKELAEIYSTADVFVNPSKEETMGLTTAEALACGTHAVVCDETAVPEVVDKNCGIVVKTGDIDALYSAINNAKFPKEACIERAKDFERNKQYGKYYELYKSILND
ncbi:MAG: glycosyltransferase [Clostridia bacterium]|nr:glycosyltransferase [Clostridia bacterium]